ncbi:MAG TPA: hypothetical protein VGR96_18005 [Acidobacteriaceae bacterium]|nr:hypothetical protein [Acidobacteriaceae bacterium]
MRVNFRALSMAVLGLCLAGLASAEKQVNKSDLPGPVQKTAEEQSRGYAVRGYSVDKEDGKLEYEVEMTSAGHTRDVTIAPDGQLMEVEEQVAMGALPADVRSGLESKAGNGKITKIESLRKHGTIVAYEAQVMTAGKHSEVQVGPDGKALDHEE